MPRSKGSLRVWKGKPWLCFGCIGTTACMLPASVQDFKPPSRLSERRTSRTLSSSLEPIRDRSLNRLYYLGCLKGASKSAQLLFYAEEPVLVLTSRILK